MKKYIITLSTLLLMAQPLVAAVTTSDVLQALVSSHNGAFGKDNLYKEQITSEQLNTWLSAINEAKKFVEAHCADTAGVKNKDLINALITIDAANVDLINTIKVTRLASKSMSAIIQGTDTFNKIQESMIKIQKNLKAKTFTHNKAEKMLAKDVLINMAMFIEITAAKAIKDISKL